jgi:hypothetical protein
VSVDQSLDGARKLRLVQKTRGWPLETTKSGPGQPAFASPAGA